MKKVICPTLLLTLWITFLCSCSEEMATPPTKILYQLVNENSTILYELGDFGDEEGAIIKDAKHSSVSRIDRINFTRLVYIYQPAEGYTGTDEVILKITRNPTGQTVGKDSLLLIKMEVK